MDVVSGAPGFVPAVMSVLAVAGCANDSSADDEGEPMPSVSAAATEATSTGQETPSVEPSTGRRISNATVVLRLTDDPDWNVAQFSTTLTGSLLREDGAASVSVSDIRSTGAGTLESLASVVPRSGFDGYPSPKRLANREIDGVESYVYDTRNKEYHRLLVGGVHDGFDFSIDFEMPVVWADGDDLIDQMLASVRIKDHED